MSNIFLSAFWVEWHVEICQKPRRTWPSLNISGMGTKLQSAINPLATSPTSSSFTLNSVDDWDYFQGKGLKEKYLQRTGLDILQDSMDRMMLEQHNIESIKKTMLMHEDIFKHQVRCLLLSHIRNGILNVPQSPHWSMCLHESMWFSMISIAC